MPNAENHLDGMPSTPPRRNQAPIPKPVPAKKRVPLIDTLSVYDYKLNQKLVNEALAIDGPKENRQDVFSGLG
jgi:hypothetical protein